MHKLSGWGVLTWESAIEYQGKKVVGAHKPNYKFILNLIDGSQVEVTPDELPRHAYKWLYQQINSEQLVKIDYSKN